MPNHVAHEFMKNRSSVIWETNHQYDKLRSEADKFIELCCSSLKLDQNDKEINELKRQMDEWIDSARKKNIAVSSSNPDSILEQLLSIYEGKVGSEFSEDELKKIEQEGKIRYAEEIPPGYKDKSKENGDKRNNVYGDFLVWKQILKYASSEKKDIILVTNDQKEDWWEILHSQTLGPRVELKKEFFKETSQKFYMYSMRSFITRFESGNEVKIERDTIDEIEFYSRIIHHKANKSDLREYYNSFESNDEVKAAKIRFQIARLENKNRKRINVIKQAQLKYADGEMPESVESMLDSTIANLEKDTIRIQNLHGKLLDQGV